jgi:hypothetical protein
MPELRHQTARIDCRRTPWDERVFDFPCAEITSLTAESRDDITLALALFDQWATTEGVRFAYGRFSPTPVNKMALHLAGFYFAEASYRICNTRVQASSAFDNLIRPGPSLSASTEDDLPHLRDILATDFEHGRIHEDPWVERAQASRRYRLWLDDLRQQGHEIFTYRLKGEVIGLHVQRGDSEQVDLVLTGVKRSHALLGASLWAEAMRLNRLRGVRKVHTLISAANIPIMNLYRRFEFQFETMLLGFHKRY